MAKNWGNIRWKRKELIHSYTVPVSELYFYGCFSPANRLKIDGFNDVRDRRSYFMLASSTVAKKETWKNSGLYGSRTHDPAITGAVLHQLSYEANWELVIFLAWIFSGFLFPRCLSFEHNIIVMIFHIFVLSPQFKYMIFMYSHSFIDGFVTDSINSMRSFSFVCLHRRLSLAKRRIKEIPFTGKRTKITQANNA